MLVLFRLYLLFFFRPVTKYHSYYPGKDVDEYLYDAIEKGKH